MPGTRPGMTISSVPLPPTKAYDPSNLNETFTLAR
jgi:hypothetical protein